MIMMIQPFLMGIMGLVILVALIAFSILWSKHRKSGEEKWPAVLVAVVVIIAAGTGIEVYLAYDYVYTTNHQTLEYYIQLDSTSSGFEEVRVPISQNVDLQNSLKIESGTGTFSIVDTQYGSALLVSFSDNIVITGRVEVVGDIGDHALTMLNSTEEHEEETEHWIRYDPHNPSDYNCSYNLWMHFKTLWESETYQSTGYLDEGWRTYWAEYSRAIV